MLADCPSCKKKISSKATTCNHCGFQIDSDNAEAVIEQQKRLRYQRNQSLQTQSFIAVLLFITGFGMMYWGSPEIGSNQHSAAMVIMVIGFIWYLINRIRIVINNRHKYRF